MTAEHARGEIMEVLEQSKELECIDNHRAENSR
jgi:hypothetical protein